ncbi:MAG: hypothetical protein GEU79_09080 [Acidimicrobiia bacterium]|nr:hypothetical protein [Acidimicrobiia bacterium]
MHNDSSRREQEVSLRPVTSDADAERPWPPGPRLIPKIPPWWDKAWSALRLDFIGIVFATLFFALSVTPSLLPRDWLYQGLVSGIMAAAGYGIGVLLGWLTKKLVLPRIVLSPPLPNLLSGLKIGVVVVAILTSILMLTFSAGWQRELEVVMGLEETATSAYLRTGGLSLLISALIIMVSRLLRIWARWTADEIGRRINIPGALATFLGGVVVGVLIITLVNGVLVRGFFAASNLAFSGRNDADKPGVVQPEAPQRSGSPESLIPWETLGRQGRAFAGGGLTAERLEQETGENAIEPVRVYVGLETASSPEVQAALAVAEIERAGAFDREVLVVATTTGTGWVNGTAAQAIELMYRGDTAIVATQYSFLPSALSFLGDREKVAESAITLFDAVHEAWAALPPRSRPDLLVYGESLGSQGSEAAFDGLADIRSKVDGALWVGPPHSNRIASQLIQRRDPGSLALAPRYADGLIVRFGASSEHLRDVDDQSWLSPRILYLRHPSDPVALWTPDLAFSRPDWLSEPRPPEVFPHMRWWPLVTLAQVSADLVNANAAPVGFGHNYGSFVLDGWVAIAKPRGWTQEDTDATREILTRVVPDAMATP